MRETNIEIMESAPIPQAILTLSLPTVLSTIISLLYSLTDTYFVGLMDDPVQLSAVALAYPAFAIIQAIGNAFGNGAPAYISRCLGAKEVDQARRTSAVSVYTSIAITLVMTLLVFFFMEPILKLLGTDADTGGPTQAYFQVIAAFSIVMVLQVILPAMLKAEGNVKAAVRGMVIGTVTNIILDPIFILGFRQGVAGAARATVIANTCAVVYYITVYLRGKTTLSVRPRDFKPSFEIYQEVLKIGIPTSSAQIVTCFITLLMNNLAHEYGNYVISGYGVGSKLSTMAVMIIVGYVSGYMPFAGYNYGAKNRKRMIEAFRFTLLSGTILCLILTTPCIWLSSAYMRAFSSHPGVIDVGVRFLRAHAFAIPVLALQQTLMATFQATGDAGKATVVSLGRQFLFYIPLLLLLNHIWHLDGLLFAQPIADILTAVTALLISIPLWKKLRQEYRPEERGI